MRDGAMEPILKSNRKKKSTASLRDLQDNIKQNTIQVIRIPEREKKGKDRNLSEGIING